MVYNHYVYEHIIFRSQSEDALIHTVNIPGNRPFYNGYNDPSKFFPFSQENIDGWANYNFKSGFFLNWKHLNTERGDKPLLEPMMTKFTDAYRSMRH